MDGDVGIVERLGKFACRRVRLTEVPVENDGDIGSVESPVAPGRPGPRPRSVAVLVRIWLAVMGENTVGILLMQTQGMGEQGHRGSEQSRLGWRAHRRTEDSILLIMAAVYPAGMTGTARPAAATAALVVIHRGA